MAERTGSADHHARVSDVLGRALDRPARDREAFVREVCGDDAELLADVLELLSETDAGDAFLNADGAIAGIRREAGASVGQWVPEIPGYSIVRTIASGGMGTVIEAQQASPRRRVALKVMRAGVGSDEALRRFRFESEVLGRLRHPHIAQVYEAGTYRIGWHGTGESEAPFFAMEFVEGAEPVTAYSDRHGLDARARIGLFRDVCSAVHFGHQRGIVHRDLKPGNVLVDKRGEVKVIDYGVARATGESTVRSSLATAAGNMVGTVRYMSPEQCRGDAGEIDARSDVYSLGVVLYELLVGRLPYGDAGGSVAAAARAIETIEPARPSSIKPAVRGDLEAVVLKALEKDPVRRYASAASLADDLERCMEDRPVEARPITTMYQLRKFAARHRGAAVAAVVVASALIGAAGLSTAMAVRATRAADSEREQREELLDLNGYLAGILTSVTPEVTRSQEVTVREMLSDAVARIEEELGDRPLLAATVRHQIGESYLSVGASLEAAPVLDAAYDTRRNELGESVETLASGAKLGEALYLLGKFEDAEGVLLDVVAMAERMGVDGSDPMAIDAITALGIIAARTSRMDEADVLMKRALDASRSSGMPDEHRLSLLNTIGMFRARQGRIDDALEMLRGVALEREELLGDDHPSVFTAWNNYGTTLTDAGRYEEAEGVHRRVLEDRRAVLGEDHPKTVSSMNNLSIAVSRLGRMDEAVALSEHVLETRRRVLGDEHLDTIGASMNLVSYLGRVKDQGESERRAGALLDEFVPVAERVLEPTNGTRLFTVSRAVMHHLKTDDPATAVDMARRTLLALEAVADDGYWQVPRFRALLGTGLSAVGEDAEAEAALRRAVEGLTATRGADDHWTTWASERLAEHLAKAQAGGNGLLGSDD